MSKKTYRAILIDPEARNVRELESTLSFAEMHELIGAETLDNFGLAAFEGGHKDSGWVDDGGLMRGEPIHAFLLPTAKDPIAGKCLIIGANHLGETASCRMPIAILRQDVTWLGLIKPEVVWDRIGNVDRSIVTYSRVKT
jgi:hypothetical protein